MPEGLLLALCGLYPFAEFVLSLENLDWVAEGAADKQTLHGLAAKHGLNPAMARQAVPRVAGPEWQAVEELGFEEVAWWFTQRNVVPA